MCKALKRFLIVFFIFIFVFTPSVFPGYCFFLNYTTYAKTLRCATCGARIKGDFLKNSKGEFFCSKRCFEKSLPKCAVCGKPAHMSVGDKYFCSQKCFESTWPICSHCKRRVQDGVWRGLDKKFLCKECAEKPKCFSCNMPADFARLDDGRYICKKCNETAVNDFVKLKKIANEVRKVMKEQLHIGTDHNIKYCMTSLTKLQEKTTSKQQGIELGLYFFSQMVEKITTEKKIMGKTTTSTKKYVKEEKYTIYFLYGIPENKLREVAAHELAHDWMQEFYPGIRDLKVKEGWAEYIASRVNTIYGRSKMNRRMQQNPDPIYGEGYRMIKKIAEQEDLDALIKFFEKKSE